MEKSEASKNPRCRYCGRDMGSMWCTGTRDMDPIDGFNNDPLCHYELIKLGGGERGWATVEEAAEAYKREQERWGPHVTQS